MNESNSTPFNTFLRLFSLTMVLFVGTLTNTMAQTPSCACKGSIQVSVDNDCSAVITADQLLANGLTCGGSSAAVVTLMKTPTSGIIDSGTGEAELTDGQLYIGKTIYAKVATAGGTNSCWTTVNVEDKFRPSWESDDVQNIVVTCPSIGSFVPSALDNCHAPKVFMVSENIIVNDCINPIFAGSDTIKMIERKFRAIDESGNISDTDCTVIFWVVTLDIDDVIGVQNVQLQCDAPYAKIPVGRPFAGNPSPVDITVSTNPLLVLQGSGVPSLHAWMPATRGAGTVDVNPLNGNLRLAAGTAPTVLPGMGAQVCFTATANGTIGFNWSASMKGSTPPAGNFFYDRGQYSVNGGPWLNLTTDPTANVGSGTVSAIAILKDQQFCFRVTTDNLARWTELMISNFTGPIARSIALTPETTDKCNIYVSYTDTEFPTIKCVKKIMRKWQILEWSCDSKIREFIQIIEIIDSKGPEFSNMKAADVATTNGHTCEGIYRLPKPTLKDNCSIDLTYDVTYAGGFIKGLKVTDADRFIPLPLGCSEIKYTAFDDCHNQTDYVMAVNVEDHTAPVAICDLNTTVGLTFDGKAWVPATSFDDGSYDDCDLAKMLVRRMNPGCTPCKTPEFPGFTHLGTFVNTGRTAPHYYYASKHKAKPEVAIKTAAAMGGYVVAINNAAENQFVYDEMKKWNLGADYLIGLKDLKNKGTFSWLSNETSRYRNWDAGFPQDTIITNANPENNLPYVLVRDANARWRNFNAESCQDDEYYYVIEITDPCGFSSGALFCCEDAGKTEMVQFRVIDKAGNWNDCMVNAHIQDKLPPSITCPAHMSATCNDYFDTAKLRHSFGWPTATDNCTNVIIRTDSLVELNSCRIGKITRNFKAYTVGGRDTARCTQIITVTGSSNFQMTDARWPKDVSMKGCEDPNDDAFGPDVTGRPDLTADNICSLVGAQYEDQIFTFNNSNGEACFKILRHWKVIDWCNFVTLPGGGVTYTEWTHTQVIKVYDDEKPVILTGCTNYTPAKTYDSKCEGGYIELTATATDVCTDQLRYSVKIYPNNGSSFDARFSKSGLATVNTQNRINSVNASGTYPIGTHRIEWAFEDRCGNVTKCTALFTIENAKAPTPYCLNGLATSLMPVSATEAMVDIWAKDFDNGSFHPCGYEVLHSFAPITLDANKKPVLVMSRRFTCADLGRRDLNVYVGVVTPTGELVQDFCSTFITIQDNFKICPVTRLVVQGSIMNPNDEPVKDVSVKLEGSEMNMITGTNGTYNFADVTSGGSYIITPSKKDDYLNGVSTLDLVMIQRHILGIEKLDTPHKLIAADVNNDKNISASDLTDLRKVILGVTEEFSNNDSWKFFDKAYNFADPKTAHTESLPLVYNLDNIASDMNVDFMAVKIGDVNGNAKANANDNATESRTSQKMILTTANQSFDAGQSIEVPVVMAQSNEIAGFQFTINFDTELFSLEAINSPLKGINDNNFGLTQLADGRIAISYNRESALDINEGNPVLLLSLKAKAKGSLTNGLWIDSAITKAEAYNADFNVMNVAFTVENRNDLSNTLYQNTPNPFKSVTTIGFELAQQADATLTIFDVTGKTIKVITNNFNKGYNSIEINRNELDAAGVLYYTLESGDFKATRKMVVVE